MATAFMFITTYAIKDGEVERFRAFLRDLLEALETEEPGALAINAYINGDGTEAAIVQLTPDAESIKRFWQILHQHTGRALSELVKSPTSVQMFGPSGDIALERTSHSAASGVEVTATPEYVSGFVRLASAGP